MKPKINTNPTITYFNTFDEANDIAKINCESDPEWDFRAIKTDPSNKFVVVVFDEDGNELGPL